jgi:xylulokinase
MTTSVPVVLAIDLGTGGPKAALVDVAGRVLASSHAPVVTYMGPDGAAEQDPHEIWDAVIHACAHLWQSASARAVQVRAVACTSQYFSSIPVAADGLPVGPCLTWLDTRGGAWSAAKLTADALDRWLERSGLFPLPSGNDPAGHVAWWQAQHPEVVEAARAFVEPVDYLTARCTGRVTATPATTYGLHAVDLRRWDTRHYDPELVADVGLDITRLAPLVDPDAVVGELTSAAAADLGAPVGIPVVAGTLDAVSGAVGVGATDIGRVGVVVGTTAVIVGHVGSFRTDPGHAVLSVPSPITDRFALLAENGLGGRAIDWVIGQVLGSGTASSPAAMLDHASFEAAARSVPAGAEGVMFLPWLRGTIAPRPDDDASGTFVGFGLHHDRRHIARAVLEGVALNLAWALPAVSDLIGRPMEPSVRLAGGVALSEVFAQSLADALGRPVERLARPRSVNARGAGVLAWHSVGEIDLVHAPPPEIEHVHEPDPSAAPRIAQRLARLDDLLTHTHRL